MKKPKKTPTKRPDSKISQLIALLTRPEGATVSQLSQALAWQTHSVRGALAGAVKKKGLTVSSSKEPGAERIYRISK